MIIKPVPRSCNCYYEKHSTDHWFTRFSHAAYDDSLTGTGPTKTAAAQLPPAAGGVATSTPAGGPKVPEGEENYQHSDSYYSDKMNSSQTGSMSGRPKVIVKERKPTKQSEAPASKQSTELS